MTRGPLVAPLTWLGVARATSERIDCFVGGLTFCFFPAAPVFWLIGHFIGGGRILFGLWILMLAWLVQASWRMAIRRYPLDMEPWSAGKAKANFWKWFTIDLIAVSVATYAFDLSMFLPMAFGAWLLFRRKRIIAIMMSPQAAANVGRNFP